MKCSLAQKQCTPCKGGTPRLEGEALQTLSAQLNDRWTVEDGQRLEREFKFKNFVEALAFTNAVGALAEAENHHPDIFLAWGIVRVILWTHKVGGLTENDFILAAKIDGIA